MQLTLGSLFDGIGGFPLAGSRHEFMPVWASEIEPWPIKATEEHFPGMKHLGDITKVHGAKIEPVDVITFGSPCTRLSVAGKHDGFDITFKCTGKKDSPHEPYNNTIRATNKYQYIYNDICPICGEKLSETNESALFFHAIRIIREMRDATNGIYPRFIVWENVPGAFSSNQGADFRSVLEEIAEAEIPMPPSGKWATAGMVRTKQVDIAWRVLDAQYWGVPQRRRRIFLVADFRGQCAGEILFVEQGLSWNFEKGREKGQEITPSTGTGIVKPMWGGDINGQTQIANASSLLRELWGAVGSQTFEKWIRGTVGLFQEKEILFGTMPRSMESETTAKTAMCEIWAASCEKCFAEGELRNVWESQSGNTPQRRKSFEQFNGEFDSFMQEVSLQTAPTATFLQYLWQASEGERIMRQSLSSLFEEIKKTEPIPINTMTVQGRPSDNGRMGSGIGNPGDPANTISAAHCHAVGYWNRRNPAESGEEGETTTASIKAGIRIPSENNGGKSLIYSFDSLASNSMKSGNPHSGGRFVEISKTIDTTIPDPSKNQGGIAILQQRGNSQESGEARQEAAGNVGASVKRSIDIIFDPYNNAVSDNCTSLGSNCGMSTGRSIVMRMREGCAGGGKGPLISEDKSLTLGCANDQTVFTYKGIIPFDTTQITSPQNGNNPKPNDPCHPLCANAHVPSAIPKQIDSTPEGITGAVSSKWAKGTGGPAGDEHYNLIVLADQGGSQMDVHDNISPTLRAQEHGHQPLVMQEVSRTLRANAGAAKQDDVSYALDTLGNHAVCIQGSMIGRADKNGPQGDGINEEVSFTLNTTDRHAVAYTSSSFGAYEEGCGTLRANGGDLGGGSETLVKQCAVATVDCRNLYENEEISGTLQTKNSGGYSLNYQNPIRINYAVRRLTPLECLRLQGFPDDWLDIEGMSDTAKYQAVGNSIAIPVVEYIMSQIRAYADQK